MRLSVALLPFIVALTALCAARQVQAASPHGAIAPATIVRTVARVYGESHPHVIHLERTTTDSTPHQVMYFIGLSGHFHKGRTQARYLYFSALADRWYVWGLAAYDSGHRLVWTDRVVPHRL